MLGSRLSSRAVGRVSTTGCSIWLEPEQGVSLVLLSNRLCPSRANKKFNSFLPKLVNQVIDLALA